MTALTHPAIKTTKAPVVKTSALTAILLLSCFVIIVIILHILRSDYNPLQGFISEYEVGAYSTMMRVAFFCLSAGSLSLIVALYSSYKRNARLAAALILLFVWSVCVALAGVFPTDLSGAPETASGNIHNNASLLGFMVLVISSFLLNRFKINSKERFYTYSRIMPLTLLLSFLAMMASVITGFIYIGLIQRIFITIVVSWLILTARKTLTV